MGWMSWELFRCQTDCTTHPTSCINADLYETMGDLLAADGYLAAGYNQISVDDCWEAPRVPEGVGPLRGSPERFPKGMRALGDYLHSKGLRFGIYRCSTVARTHLETRPHNRPHAMC